MSPEKGTCAHFTTVDKEVLCASLRSLLAALSAHLHLGLSQHHQGRYFPASPFQSQVLRCEQVVRYPTQQGDGSFKKKKNH